MPRRYSSTWRTAGSTSRTEASFRRVRAVTFLGPIAFSNRLIVSAAIPERDASSLWVRRRPWILAFGTRPAIMERRAMQQQKLDPQVVGNVGLYYVSFQMSRLGWNVLPTSRNARGIDLVAYDGTATHYVGVQVKSLSKRTAVPIGSSLDKIIGDFWVIVNRVATDPTAWVLLPGEVRDLSHCTTKDGAERHWIGFGGLHQHRL
jgi:hypothetical protein